MDKRTMLIGGVVLVIGLILAMLPFIYFSLFPPPEVAEGISMGNVSTVTGGLEWMLVILGISIILVGFKSTPMKEFGLIGLINLIVVFGGIFITTTFLAAGFFTNPFLIWVSIATAISLILLMVYKLKADAIDPVGLLVVILLTIFFTELIDMASLTFIQNQHIFNYSVTFSLLQNIITYASKSVIEVIHRFAWMFAYVAVTFLVIKKVRK